MSFMLCVPDSWKFTLKGLKAMAKDVVDSMTTTLKELEDRGYVKRCRNRNAEGQLADTEYIIYEKPADNNKTKPPQNSLSCLFYGGPELFVK
ncbi:MAG: hypothetical protein LUG24_03280 [Clostridiales bacterium]|nr:hypothetical protein [Clostridiales bacterium]